MGVPGPEPLLPSWLWLAIYFLLLGSGAVAVIGLPFRRSWLRLSLAIAYIVAMGFALLVLGSLLEIKHHPYPR